MSLAEELRGTDVVQASAVFTDTVVRVLRDGDQALEELARANQFPLLRGIEDGFHLLVPAMLDAGMSPESVSQMQAGLDMARVAISLYATITEVPDNLSSL